MKIKIYIFFCLNLSNTYYFTRMSRLYLPTISDWPVFLERRHFGILPLVLSTNELRGESH